MLPAIPSEFIPHCVGIALAAFIAGLLVSWVVVGKAVRRSNDAYLRLVEAETKCVAFHELAQQTMLLAKQNRLQSEDLIRQLQSGARV